MRKYHTLTEQVHGCHRDATDNFIRQWLREKASELSEGRAMYKEDIFKALELTEEKRMDDPKYADFHNEATGMGFTDDQADFLWDQIHGEEDK